MSCSTVECKVLPSSVFCRRTSSVTYVCACVAVGNSTSFVRMHRALTCGAQATTVLDGHVSELDEAAALMKTIEAKVLPEEKLRCITDAIEVISRTYEKAAANHRVYVLLCLAGVRGYTHSLSLSHLTALQKLGATGTDRYVRDDTLQDSYTVLADDVHRGRNHRGQWGDGHQPVRQGGLYQEHVGDGSRGSIGALRLECLRGNERRLER